MYNNIHEMENIYNFNKVFFIIFVILLVSELNFLEILMNSLLLSKLLLQ